MSFRSLRTTEHAFTLIEILVVVAILAILASIAIPSFSAARLSASKAKSAANLKNFGAAMYSFVADNNGRMPGATNTNGTLSGISPIAKGSVTESLQRQLMTYLEKDRPSGTSWVYFMKSLTYPAWQTFNKGTNDNNIPAYIACQSFPIPGEPNSFSPFGAGNVLPRSLIAVQSQLDQIRAAGQPKPYAVIEVDQSLYEAVTWNNPSWKKNLSTNALHGKVRNVLYFDGSVAAVATNNQPSPW